ncbi:unnamed protein product [Ambrosiozyma monospora]|uniref:DNA 3'-5' helicase n=1 Tax=Ambrosiozyma monospora TaxID=43982 RepID=A0A9W6T8Z0_AMBMO|nr:unnamed protein product [Ambrosiozyma monospora]
MSPSDQRMVEKLFSVGALTCLLATKETCFYCPPANAIIVMSTQGYEGKEHRYIDYSINDLLEMVGLARLPGANAKCVILTHCSQLDYYKKFLRESLPLESHFNYFLHDAFVSEINGGVINSRQDCVEWLTYTYFYQRLQHNPSFYGVKNSSRVGTTEYLSELVESTLDDLVKGKMIEMNISEDEDAGQIDEKTEEDEPEIIALNGKITRNSFISI